MPADATSIPGQPANTCSAVGLRSRFLPQTNSTVCVNVVSWFDGRAWLRIPGMAARAGGNPYGVPGSRSGPYVCFRSPV